MARVAPPSPASGPAGEGKREDGAATLDRSCSEDAGTGARPGVPVAEPVLRRPAAPSTRPCGDVMRKWADLFAGLTPPVEVGEHCALVRRRHAMLPAPPRSRAFGLTHCARLSQHIATRVFSGCTDKQVYDGCDCSGRGECSVAATSACACVDKAGSAGSHGADHACVCARRVVAPAVGGL